MFPTKAGWRQGVSGAGSAGPSKVRARGRLPQSRHRPLMLWFSGLVQQALLFLALCATLVYATEKKQLFTKLQVARRLSLGVAKRISGKVSA